ncbi:MAG: hypothetical protein CL569_10350 [Alphaproteobacteria bacterium]|nr:hypothetical protein [Alphaproteobacteria bacterium]
MDGHCHIVGNDLLLEFLEDRKIYGCARDVEASADTGYFTAHNRGEWAVKESCGLKEAMRW